MPDWPSPSTLEISCAELHALRSASAEFRLVDVRETDEWHYCRIDGASLIPLSDFVSQAPTKLADKSAPIILY